MDSRSISRELRRPRAARFGLDTWAAGVLVFVWLGSLGLRSLVSSDEGRYASLSLAMLQSGDWITPRLNGLLYFEKPPLQYWAGAVAMALLGVNEFAARLWPGLCGLATVALLSHTARRLWGPRAGLHAALVGASTTWIVVNSHFLSLDAGLTAALTLTLCGLLLADAATGRERRGWQLAAWAGVALAVLTKGLVGAFIPFAALAVTALWQREPARLRLLAWWPGALLMLALTVPWFWAVSVRHPDFPGFFFVHEHLDRFLTPVHRREGAIWYFVPWLLLGLAPWTGALPWLWRAGLRGFAPRLLLAWAVFVFAFFSLSQSKLPSYILPMFPPLVLLVTRALDQADARSLQRHLLLPAAGWLLVLAAAPFIARQGAPADAMRTLALGAAAGALVFCAGAALAWRRLNEGRRTAALAAVAAAHLLATLLVMTAHDRYGQQKSSDAIARALAPEVDASTPVFAVRAYDHTLPFYLRRPVVLVDVRDEFAFGEDAEPARWIPTLDGFAERWREAPRAAAYLAPDTLVELRRRGLPMRVVYEDARRLVVVKP